MSGALQHQRPTRCVCVKPIPMGRISGQWCQVCRLPLPPEHCSCATPEPMTVMHRRGGGSVVCRSCGRPLPMPTPERVIVGGQLVAEIRTFEPMLAQPARIGGDEP